MFVKSLKRSLGRYHFSKVLLPLKGKIQLLKSQFKKNCFIWVEVKLDVNLKFLILLGYCERMMLNKYEIRDVVLIVLFFFKLTFSAFVIY